MLKEVFLEVKRDFVKRIIEAAWPSFKRKVATVKRS
jgi:hypothetical protein